MDFSDPQTQIILAIGLAIDAALALVIASILQKKGYSFRQELVMHFVIMGVLSPLAAIVAIPLAIMRKPVQTEPGADPVT